ncbi:MAG: PEP-CTERM sorting domain-containing protein [Kiritimatiellae bacterium]|nr:PEP-CTERM sorting domain-containing protein [Kiritimatiellia bacterium]
MNDTQTYDLTAFTGRNSANTGANGLWTLTSGTATTARFQNAAGAYTANTGQRVNSTGTDNGFAVEWLGVTPVSGTIAFSIDTANGNGGSNVTDLNALSISQIPEPATFGIVLSAIGVAIIRRRRIG